MMRALDASVRSEIEFLIGEMAKLNKKISDLESVTVRQGSYLNKIASEQDNE